MTNPFVLVEQSYDAVLKGAGWIFVNANDLF